MQGNLIFTDRDGNILPEDDEEYEDYVQEYDDQEDAPLILNNDENLTDELQHIAGVDDRNNNDILPAHPIQEHDQYDQPDDHIDQPNDQYDQPNDHSDQYDVTHDTAPDEEKVDNQHIKEEQHHENTTIDDEETIDATQTATDN